MQTCNPFKALSSRSEYQNIIPAKMDWTWLTTYETPFIAATCRRPLYGRDTIDSWPRRLLCFPSVPNELNQAWVASSLPEWLTKSAKWFTSERQKTMNDSESDAHRLQSCLKYMGSQWYQYPALHFAYYSMAIRDFPKSRNLGTWMALASFRPRLAAASWNTLPIEGGCHATQML